MKDASYQVLIHGFVQGQGIRPAVARLAEQQRWSGSVRNTPQGVLVCLHNVRIEVSEAKRLIQTSHPALTTASVTIEESPGKELVGFRIEDSQTDGDPAAPIPRDVAVCAECLQEFHDQRNRRFGYGLISCTRCGPRFSIVQNMPFDRLRTTLFGFPLCAECRGEYESKDNRRHHAQTLSCPCCGPQVWAADRHQRVLAANDAACQLAANALLRGRIVALRGVGGYQLLVDATNEASVQELRRRKRRPSKPLAVLCRTVADAESLAVLDHVARQALVSPANPIVVAPRRFVSAIASGIHPHLTDIGVLLPTTAVHDRLLQFVDKPLVCTSGNIEGLPLAVTVDEACAVLSGVADLWVHHNRPIAQAVDDSVVRSIAGRAVTIRCARGLAPLPLNLPIPRPIVALGSFQKAALAWSNGAQTALGPHIGDLSDLGTRGRWHELRTALSRLYQLTDSAWAIDAHPDDVARDSIPSGAQPIAVWHHHAHIAAGMLEHGWLDRPVIGIAADGQGYGPDDTLWGGEVVWATAASFRRIAAVRTYALPGGEAAVLDAGRVAVSLLSQLPDMSPCQIAELTHSEPSRIRALLQVARSTASPQTTSLGRLFDGIAWLVSPLESAGYIGEPAVRLEDLCDPRALGHYAWKIHTERDPWALDWRPALTELLRDLRRGESLGIIAERFHRGVVEWMLEVHRRCPPLPLVVGGGVFQNRRLCDLLLERYPTDGPPLGLPGSIPPNDGGLAAGQLAIAAVCLHSGYSVMKL